MPLISTTGALNNSAVNINKSLPNFTGYQISRSLRLKYNATASSAGRLERTFGNGTQTKWTYSLWVKRGNLSAGQYLLSAASGGTNQFFSFYFNNVGQLEISGNFGGGSTTVFTTTGFFKDPAAWYHVVLRADTNNATQSDRLILWVNGTRITNWINTPLPSLGATYYFNGLNYQHNINVTYVPNNGYMSSGDGYLTEVNFIDNQALSPTDFGLVDRNGIWQPKKYTGTYTGTSFYLDFVNNASAAASTLGKDNSGSTSNNWTPTNVSVTAGITNDSMIDSPTSYNDGTVYGRGNYPTFNQLNRALPGASFTDGSLQMTTSAAQNYGKPSIFPESGKWYFEYTITAKVNSNFNQYAIYINSPTDNIVAGYEQTGQFYNGSAWNGSAVYSTWAVNGVIGVALDIDAGTVRFYYNNVAQGSNITIPAGTAACGVVYSQAASNGMVVNFGQRPFVYTPPSGFRAINTFNLASPPILYPEAHFKTSLYTGTGSNQAISNRNPNNQISFSPALVWVKARQSVTGLSNILTDIIRGFPLPTRSQLFSDATVAAESRTDRLQSFNSEGFTVGTYQDVNLSGNTFVSWQWNANKSNTFNTSGTSSSNTIVNTAAGFSMVVYAGTGSNATVGHGLPKAPEFIISKAINDSDRNWPVYHAAMGSNTGYLNSTADPTLDTTVWTASPNNTVFSIGSNIDINRNINFNIAYCWTSIPGYSSFGSYVGNINADGPFIYTGFKPKWIMIKKVFGTSNWMVVDTSRTNIPGFYNNVNLNPRIMFLNTSGTESTSVAGIDILSNGFKITDSNLTLNAAVTYIYAAFAEVPLKYARGS